MAGAAELPDIVYLGIYYYTIMSLIIFIALGNACGSGSVVERLLAKVNVASSNLVFRSMYLLFVRVLLNGRALAFQARYEGPIPFTRSIYASLAQLDRATAF